MVLKKPGVGRSNQCWSGSAGSARTIRRAYQRQAQPECCGRLSGRQANRVGWAPRLGPPPDRSAQMAFLLQSNDLLAGKSARGGRHPTRRPNGSAAADCACVHLSPAAAHARVGWPEGGLKHPRVGCWRRAPKTGTRADAPCRIFLLVPAASRLRNNGSASRPGCARARAGEDTTRRSFATGSTICMAVYTVLSRINRSKNRASLLVLSTVFIDKISIIELFSMDHEISTISKISAS